MNELIGMVGSNEHSPPACGLIHPTEAVTQLTTVGLGLLTSAMRYDGPLPDGLRAGSGKQWRIKDADIDVFVDVSAPLGEGIEAEDLSRQPSLVGVSVRNTVPRGLMSTTHFNVTPIKADEGEVMFLWKDDGTVAHGATPPLTEDQLRRVEQLFNDLRYGEAPADRVIMIERSHIELLGGPSNKTSVFSVSANRLHTDRVTLPDLVIRARLEAKGSKQSFYAAISERGFAVLDYDPPSEDGALTDNAFRAFCREQCAYGHIVNNSGCALEQLAEAGGAVLPAEVLTSVLALGDRALGILAVKNL